MSPELEAFDRAITAVQRAEGARREKVLEYAAQLAVRNRAPVAVYFEEFPGRHTLYRFPAGADA